MQPNFHSPIKNTIHTNLNPKRTFTKNPFSPRPNVLDHSLSPPHSQSSNTNNSGHAPMADTIRYMDEPVDSLVEFLEPELADESPRKKVSVCTCSAPTPASASPRSSSHWHHFSNHTTSARTSQTSRLIPLSLHNKPLRRLSHKLRATQSFVVVLDEPDKTLRPTPF
jgi:hypothetical protein